MQQPLYYPVEPLYLSDAALLFVCPTACTPTIESKEVLNALVQHHLEWTNDVNTLTCPSKELTVGSLGARPLTMSSASLASFLRCIATSSLCSSLLSVNKA